MQNLYDRLKYAHTLLLNLSVLFKVNNNDSIVTQFTVDNENLGQA